MATNPKARPLMSHGGDYSARVVPGESRSAPRTLYNPNAPIKMTYVPVELTEEQERFIEKCSSFLHESKLAFVRARASGGVVGWTDDFSADEIACIEALARELKVSL